MFEIKSHEYFIIIFKIEIIKIFIITHINYSSDIDNKLIKN